MTENEKYIDMKIEDINHLVKIDFELKIQKMLKRKQIYDYAPSVIPKLSENAKKLNKEEFS